MEPIENIRELFEKYTDGEISEAENEYLTSVLSTNSLLREEFELWKKIDKSIRKSKSIELRQKLKTIVSEPSQQYKSGRFRKTLLKKWYSIAAIFVIVFVSGYSVYYFTTQDQGQQFTGNVTDTTSQKNASTIISDSSNITKDQLKKSMTESIPNDSDFKDDKLLAMNFQESTYLESSIGQIRSEDIEIVSPEHSFQYKKDDSIVFDWNISATENIYLIILNNKEKVLYNLKIDSKPYILTQKLVPGLYYWKLETDDDLLHIDKFYIK